MALLLLVFAYIAIVIVAFGALMLPQRRRMGLPRWLLSCLAAAVAIFMLQAPACVYVPKAPGQAAVERFLLGSDSSQTLYWIEGTSDLAFAWGPRWYLRVGHVFEAGIEFVPPLRYARRDRTVWEIVNARGTRTPYPAEFGNPRYQYRALDLVSSDGAILSWHRDGLHRLEPGSVKSRVLSSVDFAKGLQATCLLPGDRTLEVYQDFDAFGKSHGRSRALLLIERDPDGRVQRQGSLSLPEDGTNHEMYHRLRCSGNVKQLLVIEVWKPEGDAERGYIYRVAPDLSSATALSRFDVVLSEHVPLSLAVTEDGDLLTTGQAVWRIGGGRVRDLDEPLRTCVWMGRTLNGIRPYPFLVAETLDHEHKVGLALAAARGEVKDASPIGARRFEPYRQAWARGKWTLGGLDEADKEDEIVTLRVP